MAGNRLEQARTGDPATRQRDRLELELAKAATSITAMTEAFSEQLLTIDELRATMPHLRARRTCTPRSTPRRQTIGLQTAEFD